MVLFERYMKVVDHLNRQMCSGRFNEWRGFEMTVSQINTLIALSYSGPMRMGQIANHLGSTLSATTPMVDRLVQKKLIRRVSDPKDRRAVICELTELGLEPTDRFRQTMSQYALKVSERWQPEQFEAVVEALELLLNTEQEVRKSLASIKLNE